MHLLNEWNYFDKKDKVLVFFFQYSSITIPHLGDLKKNLLQQLYTQVVADLFSLCKVWYNLITKI